MTTLVVGIVILVIVVMALGKSFFPGRGHDSTPGDGDYPQSLEDESSLSVPERKKPTCKHRREDRLDDFVHQCRTFEE